VLERRQAHDGGSSDDALVRCVVDDHPGRTFQETCVDDTFVVDAVHEAFDHVVDRPFAIEIDAYFSGASRRPVCDVSERDGDRADVPTADQHDAADLATNAYDDSRSAAVRPDEADRSERHTRSHTGGAGTRGSVGEEHAEGSPEVRRSRGCVRRRVSLDRRRDNR
jgi:hypothetical protein